MNRRIETALAELHEEVEGTTRWLIINAKPEEFSPDMFACSPTFEQKMKPLHDQLLSWGWSAFAPSDTGFECILIHLSRHKVENLGQIARALHLASEHAVIMVDGTKTDGVESVLKIVKSCLSPSQVLSKAHGKCFWFTADQANGAFAPWAGALEATTNPDGFTTYPGVFSTGHIDPGSAYLAEYLGGGLKGKGADLGAGWGWLSHFALKNNPEIKSLSLFEADQLALENARTNISDPRADFHWADVTRLPEVSDYDFVLSNPPFHQSRKAEPELGRKFIAKAAGLLHPKGRFYMVANRHLPYEETLSRYFNQWQETAKNPRFKVFDARKPK